MSAAEDAPLPPPDPGRPPVVYFRDGLAVVRHVREKPPGTVYDARVDGWVAPGHRLPELRRWAESLGTAEVGDEGPGGAPATPASEGRPRSSTVDDVGPAASPAAADPASPGPPLYDPRTPRPYQDDALERWEAAGRRGTVVLPTGAGKTFVAVLALHRCGARGCVVVPTRALLEQWHAQLTDAFGADRVGAWYGDEKDAGAITLTTYHSAFALLEATGDRFPLVVLDEAHHLADRADGEPSAWQDALRVAPAAARLGLTATYPDERDRGLRSLVGGVVYRRDLAEMADAELASFVTERRFVALRPDERRRYDAASAAYERFVEEAGYRERFPEGDDWWRVFMAETRRSPAARRAFRGFLDRERIVAGCEAKLIEAGRLLRWFPAERAVVFCSRTEVAETVSRRFAIPLIDAATPAAERRAVLRDMDEGRVHAVASVRVLDEGWDVPGAKLGIVLGDSTRGGKRQHAQRLGRLLRRQGDRVASLFEIVVADTHEFFASQKRGARYRRPRDPAPQLGLGL